MRPRDSSSGQLGENIYEHVGINKSTKRMGSHEKQHLIPQQVYDDSVFLQKIGFQLDHHQNGIFDKNYNKNSTVLNRLFERKNVPKNLVERYVSDKTHHGGYHDRYNQAVAAQVEDIQNYIKEYHQDLIRNQGMKNKIANRKALKEARRRVHMLQEDLRTMNRDGIDLYIDHDSNDKKYNTQKEYDEMFKKKLKEAHEKNWHKKY